MKIGITADCSSCLDYFPRKHNVKITRTAIHFGNETLIDGIDITADEFYERLKKRHHSDDFGPDTGRNHGASKNGKRRVARMSSISRFPLT